MTEDSNGPPCKVLVRSKVAVELYSLDSSSGIQLMKGATTAQAISPDGSSAFVHVSGHGVVKLDLKNPAASDALPSSFLADSAGVQMIHLSPKGRYVLTWERWYADKCPNNLKLWETATGKLLAAFPQKGLSREAWPYLQWTYDETTAFLLTTSQVRVYKEADILASTEPRWVDKLQETCMTLSVAPGKAGVPYYLTVFCTKSKDKPAITTVYQYNSQFVKKCAKSLFQAEECTTRWSPTGTACLMSLTTAVDASGESYYGSSRLWLWNAENTEIEVVPLPQEGTVQGTCWMPHPDKPPSFLTIAGKMPAMAALHHGVSGKVLFLFGNNVHRNTVAPAPHARFVCLGGFGNLAGGMGFWDVNKKKLMPHSLENATGTLRAASTVTKHSWSPDSRHFLVATTAPRMNVDNRICLYKYTGEQVMTTPWKNESYQPNQLLDAIFVPSKFSVYPDRAQSPAPERNSDEIQTASAPTAQPKKAFGGRYVPPTARNRGGGSLAERMRKEKEVSSQGAKVIKAEPEKTKSQIKREKLKKKKEQQQKETEAAEAAAKAAEVTAAAEPIDPAKRARKLKKTLKQIEELKQKTELNDDQKAKLASEAEILAELASLGV